MHFYLLYFILFYFIASCSRPGADLFPPEQKRSREGQTPRQAPPARRARLPSSADVACEAQGWQRPERGCSAAGGKNPSCSGCARVGGCNRACSKSNRHQRGFLRCQGNFSPPLQTNVFLGCPGCAKPRAGALIYSRHLTELQAEKVLIWRK